MNRFPSTQKALAGYELGLRDPDYYNDSTKQEDKNDYGQDYKSTYLDRGSDSDT